jgi:hypothetical protein
MHSTGVFGGHLRTLGDNTLNGTATEKGLLTCVYRQ